ncbi:srtB family sortase [Firmicutes bacterium CAG:791]|nr:srtB family sortase [Firmicutes bacterium CAG:791]
MRNRNMKYAALVMTAVLSAGLMAGCASGENGAEENPEIAESTGGWEEAASEETSDASETSDPSETAQEDETLLPEELEEGEEVLQRGEGAEISFQGMAPDVTPEWKDGELYLLAVSAQDSSAAALVCPVYESQEAAEADQGAWLDEGNSTDLTDPNTVIHGSIGEGSTFAGLQDYGDSEFFSSHPYLYLFSRDSISEYQIFAAYPRAHEDILVSVNGFDRDEYNQYINDIYGQRNMQAVLDPDLEQQALNTWSILTLQAEGSDGNDYLVQAVPTGVVQQ